MWSERIARICNHTNTCWIHLRAPVMHTIATRYQTRRTCDSDHPKTKKTQRQQTKTNETTTGVSFAGHGTQFYRGWEQRSPTRKRRCVQSFPLRLGLWLPGTSGSTPRGVCKMTSAGPKVMSACPMVDGFSTAPLSCVGIRGRR